MKTSQLIHYLQESLNSDGDLLVITAMDEEGNGYNEAYYAPTPGYYNKRDHEFEFDTKKKPNAICI